MRTLIQQVFFALCWSVGIVSAAPPPLKYQFHPLQERRINIGTTPELTLVTDGKTGFELVVPADATPTAKFAAQEAAELLGRALQTKISLIAAPTGNVPALVIGDVKLAAQAGLDIAKLDRDGFYIKTQGKNILLIGRDDPQNRPLDMSLYGDGGERATLFAVYDFLERFAGVRFYFPGDLGTIVGTLSDWKLPAIDISDRPDLVQRNDYANMSSKAFPPEFGKYSLRLEVLRQRRQSWTWPCCHGLSQFRLERRFAASRPDFFAVNEKGQSILEFRPEFAAQFCYSNPDFLDQIASDALAFFDRRPASELNLRPFRDPDTVGWPRQLDPNVPVYDFTPPDSYYACRCEKCSKIFGPGRNNYKLDKPLSDFMWRYYADLAERIKDKGYAAAWVYWPTSQPPEFELPSNILLVITPAGPWSCSNPQTFQAEIERLALWGKLSHNKIRMWNYMLKSPPGILGSIPPMAPRAVSQYYKAAAPYVCGAFSESGMERYLYRYLNMYVYYKVLWDNNLDTETLLEEHHRLMFAAAAEPMANIYRDLEQMWMSVIGNGVDTPDGPKRVVPSDYDLWHAFYTENVLQRFSEEFDQAERLVAEAPEALARVRLIRRELLQPMLETRQNYLASLAGRGSWKMYADEITAPPVIDGMLNDDAWKKAKPYWLTGFKRETTEVQTTVKMTFDQDFFYFAYECSEPNTDNIIAMQYEPDDERRWQNSTVELFLNPSGDFRNCYQLMVDSLGGLTNYNWVNGVCNRKWKSEAVIKTMVNPGKNWTAEIKLPRKNLDTCKTEFPANFARHRAQLHVKNEVYSWSPFLKIKLAEAENWGLVSLAPESNPSSLKYGDFEIPVRSQRWLGPWYASKILERDEKVYLTGGGSVRLTSAVNRNVVQRFQLKPSTTYEFSFFAKLDQVGETTGGGLRVRFDEMGGNVHWLPRQGTALRGTIPWTRFSYQITTSPQCGSKNQDGFSPYINPALTENCDGTAWLDHFELREVK